MNARAAASVARWLARDTFRQAWAAGVSQAMLAVSAAAVLVCLTVRLESADGGEAPQRVSLLFGAVDYVTQHGRADAVREVQLVLAGLVADQAGVLLALVWTAGLLPGFLGPDSAAVLLAKPVPRWGLLVGKYLGVVLFVAFQAVVFVAGTWLALGVRTGVWDARYLWAVPVLLAHFAIFYSFSAFLAAWTRSTVACVFGSLVFWILCWAMNYGRHALLAMQWSLGPEAGAPESVRWTMEVGYWLLPRPADLGVLLLEAMNAGDLVGLSVEIRKVQDLGAFHPVTSVLASLAFAVVMLAMAAYELAHTDY